MDASYWMRAHAGACQCISRYNDLWYLCSIAFSVHGVFHAEAETVKLRHLISAALIKASASCIRGLRFSFQLHHVGIFSDVHVFVVLIYPWGFTGDTAATLAFSSSRTCFVCWWCRIYVREQLAFHMFLILRGFGYALFLAVRLWPGSVCVLYLVQARWLQFAVLAPGGGDGFSVCSVFFWATSLLLVLVPKGCDQMGHRSIDEHSRETLVKIRSESSYFFVLQESFSRWPLKSANVCIKQIHHVVSWFDVWS